MDNLEIKNNKLELVFSKDQGRGLTIIKDVLRKQNFLSKISEFNELYSLELKKENGCVYSISSYDSNKFSYKEESTEGAKILCLDFFGHKDEDINVHCQVILEKDSFLSHWRISIENHTDSVLLKVRYPIIIAACPLKLDFSEEYLMVPFLDNGYIIKNPSNRLPLNEPIMYLGRWRLKPRYPGMCTMQFMSLYNKISGLYLSTYDTEGYTKNFMPIRRFEGLDLTIEHIINENEIKKGTITLPYDTVIGTFEGDWRSAADVYKEWAINQPMCAKRLDQRSDIAEWYKKAPTFITYRVRGKADFDVPTTPNTDYYPHDKVPSIMKKYSEKIGSPITVVCMHWEKNSPWFGPDYFPPFGGEESFKNAFRLIHQQNNYLCMYVQPIWHYRSKCNNYQDFENFKKEGINCVAIDRNGQPYLHMRDESDAATYCMGSNKAKKILKENILKCIDLGADMVQIDSILGFQATECYSNKHDHPSGLGKWMFDHISELLLEIKKEGVQKNEQFVLSTEGAPCEVYIPFIDGYDSRRIWFPMAEEQSVPLFIYVYHPYILGFGGEFFPELNTPDVLSLKAAQMMVDGLIINLTLGEGGLMTVSNNKSYNPAPNQSEALDFIRLCSKVQREYARDYLIFGEMLSPALISNVPYQKLLANSSILSDGELHEVEVPYILHSSWKSSSNKVGHVLANYTSSTCEPIVKIEKYPWMKNPVNIIIRSDNEIKEMNKVDVPQDIQITIKPKSVYLIEVGPTDLRTEAV